MKEAISDLLTDGRPLVESTDSDTKGFHEALYEAPRSSRGYMKLMRAHLRTKAPNSRRLAKHKKTTIEYFKKVQKTCRPGRCLTIEERVKVGTKKHSTTVLDPNSPAPTITTLPDDVVHYCE